VSEIPKRVYVYGTGDFSNRISVVLAKMNIEVISRLEFDSKRLHEGVIKPDQVEIPQEHTVLIALGNPEADIRQISINLQNLGFRIILPVEIAQFFHLKNFNLDNYWLTGDLEMFNRDEERINKARVLFKEKKSQELFKKILDYRKNSKLASLPNLEPLDSQYMPSDLPWVSTASQISIIDCGAFTGDTIRTFLNKGVVFENYFAFEPDADNYNQLQQFVSKNYITSIFPLKLATWNENAILKFQKSGGNNSGAHLTQQSSTNLEKVLAVKLDNFLATYKIDLIKMDIEGAEIESLKGLIKIIKTYKPYLAISAYHKPSDLWEIPIFITEISSNYELYIRVYGEQTFDTVLYCIPSN
jgi:FkbM family methyltransferase